MSAASFLVRAQRAEGGAERRPEGAEPSPRAVTRGEDKPHKTGRRSEGPRAIVDWLNMTFPRPSMSSAGFVALLGRMLGRPVSAVVGGGLLGFEYSVKLYAHHGATKSAMGFLAFGGESQMGRWLLSLSGSGCAFVRDWPAIAELGESLGAKITRLDLAVDFLNGEYSVEEAVDWYGSGGFDFDGRMRPSSRLDGDWLNETGGRTLYVGKAQNGKMARVYEKGRQLGDPDSQWLRIEVQLGSRDRVIPWEALTQRDEFFAGCYPVLAGLVEAEAQAVTTSRAKGQTTLGHLWYHFKRSYGKLVDVLASHVGVGNAELVEEVRIVGLPRRVDHSSTAAGVTWEDVLSQAKRSQK